MEKQQQELDRLFAAQVFKQKLKNVLSEHHNTMTEMKMDGVAAASLVQSRNTQAEFQLRMEVHNLQSNRREKEQHSQNFFRELQLVRAASASGSEAHFLFVTPASSSGSPQKHQVELMEVASSYDRRIKGERRKAKLQDSGNGNISSFCCGRRSGGEIPEEPAVGAGGRREAEAGPDPEAGRADEEPHPQPEGGARGNCERSRGLLLCCPEEAPGGPEAAEGETLQHLQPPPSQASAASEDLSLVSCEGAFRTHGRLLWQRELAEATKVQAQALRELSAAQQEMLRLREAVREAEGKLLAAREQLERSRKEKARMKVRERRRQRHTCWRRCSSPLVNTHPKAPRSRRRCRPNR